MKFSAKIIVIGGKSSKGEMEGKPYDHFTVFTTSTLDNKNGNAFGNAGDSYRFGLSENIEKFKGIKTPFEAEGDFEIVTTGKSNMTILHDLRPLTPLTKG